MSWGGAALLLVACSNDDSSRGDDAVADSYAPGSPIPPREAGYPGDTDGAPTDPGPSSPPPEREIESSFLAPVVTGRWIWTANPESGRVARIDGVTREVTTLPAGLSPTYLAAIDGAGDARALVINAGGSDATLFRQGTDGALSELDIPIHQGATAWAVGSMAARAIALARSST